MSSSKKKLVFIKKDESHVPWSKIIDILEKRGMKDSSVSKYVKLMKRYNDKLLGKKGSDNLYWEKFCNEANVRIILKDIINNYKMSERNLVSYITQMKKVLEAVPEFPSEWAVNWGHIIHEIHDDYGQFISKYKDDTITPDINPRARKTKEELTQPWDKLGKELDACIHSCQDPRAQILSIVYKNGYVLRPYELNHTVLIDDDESNFLDLSKCTWNIRITKTFKRDFIVPEEMCKAIKEITDHSKLFYYGNLIPKKDGTSYKGSEGFYKTWTDKYGMSSAYTYRHSYESWFANKEETTTEQLEGLAKILGHKMSTAIVHYILPKVIFS